MPIPTPREGEERSDFLNRCMADPIARSEFTDAVQRMAVCITQWDRRDED